MANVTKFPNIPVVFKYTLELDQTEAQVLADVLSSVGGSMQTPRGITDAISVELRKAGIIFRSADTAGAVRKGCVSFEENQSGKK